MSKDYLAHRTGGNVRVSVPTQSFQNYNKPLPAHKKIPSDEKIHRKVSLAKRTYSPEKQKSPQMYNIADPPAKYFSLGSDDFLPHFDNTQIKKHAYNKGIMEKCVNMPVDKPPAIKCAKKVQSQINFLMNILDAIQSEDSKKHIKSQVEPDLDKYSVENLKHIKSQVEPHLDKYSVENLKHVECNQVEQWSKDCQTALKETKEYLKQIIATAPIDSLLRRLNS
jgi:hypothetical protein